MEAGGRRGDGAPTASLVKRGRPISPSGHTAEVIGGFGPLRRPALPAHLAHCRQSRQLLANDGGRGDLPKGGCWTALTGRPKRAHDGPPGPIPRPLAAKPTRRAGEVRPRTPPTGRSPPISPGVLGRCDRAPPSGRGAAKPARRAGEVRSRTPPTGRSSPVSPGVPARCDRAPRPPAARRQSRPACWRGATAHPAPRAFAPNRARHPCQARPRPTLRVGSRLARPACRRGATAPHPPGRKSLSRPGVLARRGCAPPPTVLGGMPEGPVPGWATALSGRSLASDPGWSGPGQGWAGGPSPKATRSALDADRGSTTLAQKRAAPRPLVAARGLAHPRSPIPTATCP